MKGRKSKVTSGDIRGLREQILVNAKVLFPSQNELKNFHQGNKRPTDRLQILTTRSSQPRHYTAILVISQFPTSPLHPLGRKIASTTLAYTNAEDALLGLLDIVSEGLDRKSKGPVEADLGLLGEVEQLVSRVDVGWYAITYEEWETESEEGIVREHLARALRKMANT